MNNGFSVCSDQRSIIKVQAVSFHTVAKEMFGDNHKNFKCDEHKFMKTTERFKQLGQLFLHLRTISTVCYCWFM